MDSKALWNLTYGLYLLTAREDGKDNGCIINTAVQVANDPVRISISVIKENKTCDMIKNTGLFNLSAITTEADFSLFRRFGMQSGRNIDKFEDFPNAVRAANTIYRLNNCANAVLTGLVVDQIDLGSHMLFIAEVIDGEVLSNAPCCTYSYYQSNIKPKPQKSGKTKWVCTICGYTHEAEELPDDFMCPLCNHPKEDFEKVI